MEPEQIFGQPCPDCGQPSLEYDSVYKLYECKNSGCRSVFNQKDLDRKRGVPVEKPKMVTYKEQTAAYWRRIALEPEPAPDYTDKPNKSSRMTAMAIIAGSIVTAIIMVYVVYPLLNTPFEQPLNFTVSAGNMQNTLSWDGSASADGVTIVYSTSGYPNSPSDGMQLYSGTESPFVHDDLDYNTKYYYAMWSHVMVNSEPQYSDICASAAAIPYWRGTGGEEINEYVYCNDNYVVVGADNEYIELTNNPEAQDVAWSQLRQFLRNDDTDEVIYDDDSFVCADFAEMLHNNAEEAGIRAAYVVIDFVEEGPGHACNAFYTTDLGLVYIDCTGTEEGSVNADKRVEIAVGEQYIPKLIFRGLASGWYNMGEVDEYWIIW